MYTKFHKDWFRHSKVDLGGDMQTPRQHGDLISLLSFFQNKESGLETPVMSLKGLDAKLNGSAVNHQLEST
jgi:hypothetical protein